MNRAKAEALSLLLLIAGSGSLPAEEADGQAEEAPSMELLEFLGDFETPEGEWFDPLRLVERMQDQAKPKVTGDD
jgi:hypothetical protein